MNKMGKVVWVNVARGFGPAQGANPSTGLPSLQPTHCRPVALALPVQPSLAMAVPLPTQPTTGLDDLAHGGRGARKRDMGL